MARRNSHLLPAIVLIAVAGYAPSGLATVAPAHDCVRPARPFDIHDEVLWNGFVDAVNAYRACISDYIERNHDAANAHRTAANRATDEWNDFVRRSLNVPEHFPWPPDG
jgi:hypothetical protein